MLPSEGADGSVRPQVSPSVRDMAFAESGRGAGEREPALAARVGDRSPSGAAGASLPEGRSHDHHSRLWAGRGWTGPDFAAGGRPAAASRRAPLPLWAAKTESRTRFAGSAGKGPEIESRFGRFFDRATISRRDLPVRPAPAPRSSRDSAAASTDSACRVCSEPPGVEPAARRKTRKPRGGPFDSAIRGVDEGENQSALCSLRPTARSSRRPPGAFRP